MNELKRELENSDTETMEDGTINIGFRFSYAEGLETGKCQKEKAGRTWARAVDGILKLVVSIILAGLLAILASGCTKADNYDASEPGGFFKQATINKAASIPAVNIYYVVDNETGVNYIVAVNSHGISIYPRLQANTLPYVTERKEE